MILSGKCLCGAVAFSADAPPVFMGNCYCRDCQRESGTGHITGVAVPNQALEVTGATKTYTKPSDSGQTITNTFCPVCATTLFTNPSGLPGLAVVRAGTLDDSSHVKPQMNMYVACAPVWDQPDASIMGFSGMAPATGR